jgi:hypothetical protein
VTHRRPASTGAASADPFAVVGLRPRRRIRRTPRQSATNSGRPSLQHGDGCVLKAALTLGTGGNAAHGLRAGIVDVG